MRIFILTEGGKKYGYGHITRCTSLYDELEKRNYVVEFVINGDNETLEFLEGRKATVTDWLSNKFISDNVKDIDLVIVDSYLMSEKFCCNLTSSGTKCLFIDDNNRINYNKGLVINPSIFGDQLKYPKSKELKYFLGQDYIILRKSFKETKKVIKEKELENILITMGGSDLVNLTSIVLMLLVKHYPNLNKKVIVGQGYKYLEVLEQEADSNTEIYRNADENLVKDIMMHTDLAISAAGQTIYELIKTMTPFIPIQVVDNQKNNIEGIKKLNLARKVLSNYTDPKKFEKYLLEEIEVMNNANSRFVLTNRMTSIIDGKGPERIIDILLNEYR